MHFSTVQRISNGKFFIGTNAHPPDSIRKRNSWTERPIFEKFVLQIFMHKSAMQMQHARDLQRGVGASAGSGSSGGSLAVIGSSGLSGLPAVMGAGAEVKPHQCQQCLKSFSSNHQLVQHIRVHTGEKPYKCSYCDRRFKQLSHVQQHTRLHTGKFNTFNYFRSPKICLIWNAFSGILCSVLKRDDVLLKK